MKPQASSHDCAAALQQAIMWRPLTGVEGGFSPVNFQLVMDRPERVRRVMPPTTTSTKTQAEQTPSHAASWRRCPEVRPAVSAAGPYACGQWVSGVGWREAG